MPATLPKRNGMVYAMSSIIDVIVASAGEAEYGITLNAQQGIRLRNIAIAMGHPQGVTPILCDNLFAIGLATDTIKQKSPRASICAFIGYEIAYDRGNFEWSTCPVNSYQQITLRNPSPTPFIEM